MPFRREDNRYPVQAPKGRQTTARRWTPIGPHRCKMVDQSTEALKGRRNVWRTELFPLRCC